MAIGTITQKTDDLLGTVKLRTYEVVLPTSYTTGGDSLTAAMLGLTRVISCVASVAHASAGATAVVCRYDHGTSKLQCYWTGAVVSTALAEVTSTTDLHLLKTRLVVFGY